MVHKVVGVNVGATFLSYISKIKDSDPELKIHQNNVVLYYLYIPKNIFNNIACTQNVHAYFYFIFGFLIQTDIFKA